MESFLGTLSALLFIIIGGLLFFIKDLLGKQSSIDIEVLEKEADQLSEQNTAVDQAVQDQQNQIEEELTNASNEKIIHDFHNAFSHKPGSSSASTETPNDEDPHRPHD